MPGIYIHIPFCKRKCHYCNFYSSTLLYQKQDFLEALIKEIRVRRDYLPAVPLQTLYFGGGTPSLLTSGDLTQIIGIIYQTFPISPDAEITLEANPDDLTEKYLDDLSQLPVNRLSIGIQSFSDCDLHFLNRIHSAAQAVDSIKLAQEKGFANLSIDLMYGIPTLTVDQWRENLHTAVSLNVPHISAYALTVEPGTVLAKLVISGKAEAPDEEAAVDHFNLLCDVMEHHGYSHYEISNFGKGNLVARHNVSYWTNEPYLGLGPSAHSYNGTARQWNKADVKGYMASLKNGFPDAEMETLTPDQQYNEYVMTSLRTMWGCSAGVVRDRFGKEMENHLLVHATPWIASAHLIREEDVLKLTRRGKLFADRIASDLFQVEE
ncbi:MAG: radical SAM family heme chaperone HemW [Bacteroidales bacterium]|nr:radical SAM family heme chaperone HemW [Lentimicrobiaceae bacterium]MDD5694417.1 radical SAM family heme chaperone HemW [Bacteroidales bacterium]